MNTGTGNELYSVLSRLYNKEFLLLTELPQMVTVLETNYQMEYSPRYNRYNRQEGD